MKSLQVKLLRAGAVLPARATVHSAGYDLSACLEEPVLLKKGRRVTLPTGVAVALEEGTVGLVFGRSSLGVKQGIAPSNAVGVIDADYRGELHVSLTNHTGEDYTIHPGDRVAQLVIVPILTPEVQTVEELPETARGDGGFGSTGR